METKATGISILRPVWTVIVLLLTAIMVQAENPIQNADFETGSLTNWNSPQQSGGTKTIHEVLSGTRTGCYVLKAVGDPNNAYNSFLTLTQSLTIEPYEEEEYVLTGDIRVSITDTTSKSAYLAIRERNSQGQTIVYRQAMIDLSKQDWQKVSCEFSPTANTASMQAYVVISNLYNPDRQHLPEGRSSDKEPH